MDFGIDLSPVSTRLALSDTLPFVSTVRCPHRDAFDKLGTSGLTAGPWDLLFSLFDFGLGIRADFSLEWSDFSGLSTIVLGKFRVATLLFGASDFVLLGLCLRVDTFFGTLLHFFVASEVSFVSNATDSTTTSNMNTHGSLAGSRVMGSIS